MSQNTMPVSQIRRRKLQRPLVPGRRQKMYDVIFEAETRLGKAFDIALLIAILISVTLVALETVPAYSPDRASEMDRAYDGPVWTKAFFSSSEWFLTGLFTIEYVARLCCVRSPWRYARSFWGIIDLLSILPTWLSFFFRQTSQSFVILRSIRLLRVFRVLKLWRMINDADELAAAVWNARHKVIVFLTVILVAVTISGSLVYHIENSILGPGNASNDFSSIPQAMYWAVVTMTTVGYGDVVPHTTVGKMISATLILLGYSLIIVPTGFVGVELTRKLASESPKESVKCAICHEDQHLVGAHHCYRCGTRLSR